MENLPPDLQQTVLERLHVTPRRAGLLLLDRLVSAYVRTVPWESASRIVRRGWAATPASCPRWPDRFWLEHLEKGTGGTCFESNYAFYALLTGLGYQAYLTINNMGQSVGCHTAIVVSLGSQKWLVDVGLPLFAPLPLDAQRVMHRSTPLMRYSIRPEGDRRFQIERHPHPSTNAFTLIDRPVNDAAYRRATTADYGPRGLFLDRVIVNKVVDGAVWRFNSEEQPYRLEAFREGRHSEYALTGDVPTGIAQCFALDEGTVRQALSELTRKDR